MTNTQLYYWLGMLFLCLLASCQEGSEELNGGISEGEIQIRSGYYTIGGDVASLPGENDIHELHAYLFQDGRLIQNWNDLTSKGENNYDLQLKDTRGTIYFTGNIPTITVFPEMDETEFLHSFLQSDTETKDFLSGKLVLDKNTSRQVFLKHGTARIDLALPEGKVKVSNVQINHASDVGYIFASEMPDTPDEANYSNRTILWEEPVTTDRQGICYLYEQKNEGLEAIIQLSEETGSKTLKATFPRTLKRNAVYTIRISDDGELRAEIAINEWNDGGITDVTPEWASDVLINTEESQLSEGVLVSQEKNAMTIPFRGSDILLALDAPGAIDLIVETPIPELSITPVEEKTNYFQIRTLPLPIGKKEETVSLRIKYKDLDETYDDRLLLTLQANDVQMEGILKFDKDFRCDFDRYIDGELARITLPAGKILKTEGIWLKSVADENNPQQIRLLGGWKPNDPEADGRIQEGKLLIIDADNVVEEYVIQRRNYGLPVVQIKGTWWCKYNLRGNANRFEDQISIQTDPSKKQKLYDYLLSCPDDEWVKLWGDAYQGDHPEGMPLQNNGNGFYYDGYRPNNTVTVSPLPATQMAPDGYELPTYEDFWKFATWTGGEDSNIGYKENDGYYTTDQSRIALRNHERSNLVVKGQNYGPVHLHSFRFEGETEEIVLWGPGSQKAEQPGSGFVPMTIVFATHHPKGKTWLLEGYPQSTGTGNWYKAKTLGGEYTYVIRCIKTPVEYIYD